MGLEERGFSLLPLFIWLYCIFWWFIQDAAKVYVYHVVGKYKLFEEINQKEVQFISNPGMSATNVAQYQGKSIAKDDSMAFLSKSAKSGHR
jgi:H+-transporting ATPase